MRAISRAIGAVQLLVKANAPTILVSGGVVTMGVAVVSASKQTLKVEEVLKPHVDQLHLIESIQGGLQGNTTASYSDKDAQQDRFRVYARVGVDLGRLYAVPIVLFTAGAGLVFGGHRIMLKRNATLAIAFTGLKKTFDAYRTNVVENFGSEADQAMYGGHKLRQVIDPTTNEVAYVNERDWEQSSLDPYNRVFEQGASSQWEADLGVNKMFISNQMRFAQERLNRRGVLYLSDVYKALGFEETDVSRVVGWKVRTNPDGSKDIPFVDFGLDKPHHDDFKYSRDKAVYLDFNCQGLIIGGKIQKILERA